MEAEHLFSYHFQFYFFMILLVLTEVAHPSPTTVTSCPADHYAVLAKHDGVIQSCQLCQRCLPGYGVQQPCSATENTVCRHCPVGTFSNKMSPNESCQPCRTCDETGIKHECSPISDAVCNKPCVAGKYYDQTVDECKRCSFCFPDHPNAKTVRIRACQSQGLPDDFQCSPLPSPDVVEDWAPPLMIAVPDSSRNAHREWDRVGGGGGGGDRTSPARGFQLLGDINSDDQQRTRTHHHHGDKRKHGKKDWRVENIPLGSRTHDDVFSHHTLDFFDYSNSQSSYFDLIEGDRFDENPMKPTLVSTPSPSVPESQEISSKFDVEFTDLEYESEANSGGNDESNPQHGKIYNEPNSSQDKPYHRTLSSADIGLVVGIALGCCVLTFLVTALTCHCCLVRRGKNVGPKVAATSCKAPVNAWTYVDLMPTTEHSPAIESPTMSRKITCV